MRIPSPLDLGKVLVGALAIQGASAQGNDITQTPPQTPQEKINALNLVKERCGHKDTRNLAIHEKIKEISAFDYCYLKKGSNEQQVDGAQCDVNLQEINALVNEFNNNIDACEAVKKAAGVYAKAENK